MIKCKEDYLRYIAAGAVVVKTISEESSTWGGVPAKK